jgi:type IV secretion system protein VirB4
VRGDPEETRFLPLSGHWTDQVVIDRRGWLYTAFHVAGKAAELADGTAIRAAHLAYNGFLRGLGAGVQWWTHFIRRGGQSMTRLPAPEGWYPARFDTAYYASQGDGALFRNDTFITLGFKPDGGMRAGLRAMFGGGAHDFPQVSGEGLEDFEALARAAQDGLADYGARRLGIDVRDGVRFSEIGEALHLALHGRFLPVPLSRSRLGRMICPERLVTGHREYQFVGEGPQSVGALLSILEYPEETWPGMFAELQRAPFPLTLMNAGLLQARRAAVDALNLRANLLRAGQDDAEEQDDVAAERRTIARGRVASVRHSFGLAVRASDIGELDRRVSVARDMLSRLGMSAVRESSGLREGGGLRPAIFAQLPGNARWWTRPGLVTTRQLAGAAAPHDVPRGRMEGRWGAPLLMLKTTAGTEHAFHVHVQGSDDIPAEDLGNLLLVGRSGSGKSTLIAAMLMGALRVPGLRAVCVDWKYGLSAVICAADGAYLPLAAGVDSGAAPLLGLQNRPDDLAHMTELVRGLILLDDAGPLSAEEESALPRALRLQMMLQPEDRSLAGVAAYLGEHGQHTAGFRLQPWCRGNKFGWAFDGRADRLGSDARLVGYETSALLRSPACSPMLAHLFYRMRQRIDGRPFLLIVDEMWATDAHPAFRGMLNDLLKTIRKEEGALILATQSAADALNSPIAHTLKQQIPTKIFFRDGSAAADELCTGLGISEAEHRMVTEGLPRHGFLVSRPGGSFVGRLDLSGMREHVAVLSARKATYDLMVRLRARYGQEPEAWVPHFEREAPILAENPLLVERAA